MHITMKIGILGGAFDPITRGHIDVAKHVLNSEVGIDEVWILPCYESMTKKQLKNSYHRLQMCQLAIKNEPNYNIKICDFEIKNKLCCPTYDIILKFYESFDKENTYYFIIGMDNAIKIKSWENYQKLLEIMSFIVVSRMEELL